MRRPVEPTLAKLKNLLACSPPTQEDSREDEHVLREADRNGLRQIDAGTPVLEVTRKVAISGLTYYFWRNRYGQMVIG